MAIFVEYFLLRVQKNFKRQTDYVIEIVVLEILLFLWNFAALLPETV